MTLSNDGVPRSEYSHSGHRFTIRLEWGNGPFLQADLSVVRSLFVLPFAHHGPAEDDV